MEAKRKSALSKQCFHGAPMPKSIEKLWDAVEEEDDFITDTLALTLLESRDALNDGYGDELLEESEDTAANVRAHRKVFERLAFFAQGDDGELFAFDLETGPKDDPPIVKLDTEGEYDWVGVNLAETIFRLAEDVDEGEEAESWLEENEWSTGPWGELGSTTGHLPSLGKLQAGLYWELVGKPRPHAPTPERAADPHDAATWFLRPGPEVLAALQELHGIGKDEFPEEQWLECDGEGRVTTVWLHETEGLTLHGVAFGDSHEKVMQQLGKPKQEWDEERARWDIGASYVLVEFEGGEVTSLFVAVDDE
jgi:hypothetical protein